jgi:hypothetical protein
VTVSDTPVRSADTVRDRLTVTPCDGATRVSKREPDPCLLDGCDDPSIRKSDYCEAHTHAWIAAAEVPLDNGRVAGAVRRAAAELKEATWVRVLDVYCSTCRQTFAQARETPCNAYSTVLRGGPLGTRKRRVEDDDGDTAVVAGP